jgi:SEC-C motif-containing protein
MAMIHAESNCPCCSGKKYSECCQPFHSGKARPDTAEKLMRSRYCAYVVGNMDYLAETSDPRFRDSFDAEAALAWSKESEWLGLEIVATRNGKAGDSEGEVEFKARYRRGSKEMVHHEVSLFTFPMNEKRWFYTDGKEVIEPIRAEPKVGRNDPCPCGSGKKFKKCHG